MNLMVSVLRKRRSSWFINGFALVCLANFVIAQELTESEVALYTTILTTSRMLEEGRAEEAKDYLLPVAGAYLAGYFRAVKTNAVPAKENVAYHFRRNAEIAFFIFTSNWEKSKSIGIEDFDQFLELYNLEYDGIRITEIAGPFGHVFERLDDFSALLMHSTDLAIMDPDHPMRSILSELSGGEVEDESAGVVWDEEARLAREKALKAVLFEMINQFVEEGFLSRDADGKVVAPKGAPGSRQPE